MKPLLLLSLLVACADPWIRSGANPIVACLSDGECPAGFYCQAGGCQVNPRTCVTDNDCVLGESCISNPGCTGTSDAGLQCPALSICSPTNAPYCAACRSSEDCRRGAFCVQLSGSAQVCSQSCAPKACPVGAACATIAGPDGGAVQTCLPASGSCP